MPALAKKSRRGRGARGGASGRAGGDKQFVAEVLAVPVVAITAPVAAAEPCELPIATATLIVDPPASPVRPATPPFPSTPPTASEASPSSSSAATSGTTSPSTTDAKTTIHDENLATVARNVCCGLGPVDPHTTFIFTCKRCNNTVGETLCICGSPLDDIVHVLKEGHQFTETVVFEPNSRRNVCNCTDCASDSSSVPRAYLALNADNFRGAVAVLRFAIEGGDDVDDHCFPAPYLVKSQQRHPKKSASTASAAQGYVVLGCTPPLNQRAVNFALVENQVKQFIADGCCIPKGTSHEHRPSSKWKRTMPSIYVLLALFARMLKVLPQTCACKIKTAADAEDVRRMANLIRGEGSDSGGGAAAAGSTLSPAPAAATARHRKRKSQAGGAASAASPDTKAAGAAQFGDTVPREVVVLYVWARVSGGFAQLTSKSQAVTRELRRLLSLFPDLERTGVMNMMLDYFSVALAVHIGSSGALAPHAAYAEEGGSTPSADTFETVPTPLTVLIKIYKTHVTSLTRYVMTVNTAASGTTGVVPFVIGNTMSECSGLTAASVEQMPEFKEFCAENAHVAIVSVFPSDVAGQPVLYALNPSVPNAVREVVKRANKLLGEVLVLKDVILQLLMQPDNVANDQLQPPPPPPPPPVDDPDDQLLQAADLMLSMSRFGTPMKTPAVSRFASPTSASNRAGSPTDADLDLDDDDDQPLPTMTPVAAATWEDSEWV